MNAVLPFEVGEGWTWRKRAALELWPLNDGEKACLLGWEVDRSCGCQLRLALRMDDKEPAFAIRRCREHEAQCRRVLDALHHMPPSEEAIITLAARLLDAEIEPWRGYVDREDWPVHQPEAPDAPIPGRHWYSGCSPDCPRVDPATGCCEECGREACRVCGRENCPEHP